MISETNLNFVDPYGIEPQSKEPESFILSIKLWVPILSALFVLRVQR